MLNLNLSSVAAPLTPAISAGVIHNHHHMLQPVHTFLLLLQGLLDQLDRHTTQSTTAKSSLLDQLDKNTTLSTTLSTTARSSLLDQLDRNTTPSTTPSTTAKSSLLDQLDRNTILSTTAKSSLLDQPDKKTTLRTAVKSSDGHKTQHCQQQHSLHCWINWTKHKSTAPTGQKQNTVKNSTVFTAGSNGQKQNTAFIISNACNMLIHVSAIISVCLSAPAEP